MNDLEVIRETLDVAPPSAGTTAKARNRLTSAIEAADRRKARRLPSSLRSLWTPHAAASVRWSLAGAAAVAGVVMVVLAATMATTGQPAGTTPGTAAPETAHLSARALLLSAASQAARAEAATSGRYWHVRRIVAGGPYRVGTSPHQYYVVGSRVVEQWMARSSRDKSWEGQRDLGFAPRTEADKRAWRAAGAPKSSEVDSDPDAMTWRMAPGKGTLGQLDASERYLSELGGFRFDQVQRLPTDPAKLRALFVARIAVSNERLAPEASVAESHLRLFESMSELLLDVPTPPDVRAAAFRVLAEIPGVHSMGDVTDSQGRPGVGIELTHTSSGAVWHSELVLDPATNLILSSTGSAYMAGGDASQPEKEQTTVILDAGWTDDRPRTPAVP